MPAVRATRVSTCPSCHPSVSATWTLQPTTVGSLKWMSHPSLLLLLAADGGSILHILLVCRLSSKYQPHDFLSLCCYNWCRPMQKITACLTSLSSYPVFSTALPPHIPPSFPPSALSLSTILICLVISILTYTLDQSSHRSFIQHQHAQQQFA